MSSETHEIILRGRDNAGESFSKLVREARTATQQIKGSFKEANQSLQDTREAAAHVGTGLGLLAADFTLASRSAVDQQREIDSLRRTYGDAADQLIQLSDEIQKNTIFSNDQARQAELTAGTLARNYGFTASEIAQVVQISADLASVTGFALPDATERVVSAMRGETESSEALGLTLNQQSIDREGLTLTMSNEEAAHFRLKALIEQSSYATGAAGERAQTTAGQVAQLTNRVQDAATDFAAWTGPIGESAAGLSNVAVEAGLAVGGVAELTRGIKGLIPVMSTVGPLSLALGAALGSAFLAEDVIANANKAGSSASDSFFAGFLSEAASVTKKISPGSIGDAFFDDVKRQYEDILRSNKLEDVILNVGFHIEGDGPKAMIDELDLTVSQLQKIVTDSGQTAGQVVLRMAEELGYSVDQLTGKLVKIDNSADEVTRALIRQQDAAYKASKAAKEAGASYETLAMAQSHLDTGIHDYEGDRQKVDDFNASQIDALHTLAEVRAEGVDAAKDIQDAWGDLTNSFIDDFNRQQQAIQSYYEALDVAVGFAGQLQQLGGEGLTRGVLQIGNAARQSTDALEAGYQVIVGNTDAIGQQAQKVNDWAENLIGVEGTYAKIDNLLADGQITLTTYNKAQEAGNRIFADNADIQEDILRIQAKQSPVLADLIDDQAAYIDQLADMDGKGQLVALGFMDQAESMKAQQAAALAASAAMGELGENGETTATKIITGAAEADPVLKAMLEDLGIIDSTDGTIKVNFPKATSLHDDIKDLTGAIDDLTAAIDGVPILRPQLDHTQFDADMADVLGQYDQLDALRKGLNGGDGQNQAISEPALLGSAFKHLGLGSRDDLAATLKLKIEVEAGDSEATLISINKARQDIPPITTVKIKTDPTNSHQSISGVERELIGLPDLTTPDVTVDPGDSFDTLTGVKDGLGDIDGTSAYASVDVGYSGISLSGVISQLDAIDGRVATSYVQQVALGLTGGQRNGGMVGAANGRMFGAGGMSPIMMDEAGSEMVIQPNGSVVIPHTATKAHFRDASVAAPPVQIIFNAPVYGVSDLDRHINDALRRAGVAGGRR